MEEKAVSYANEPEYYPIGALQPCMGVVGREQRLLFVRIRKGKRVTREHLSDEWVNVLVQHQLGESFSAYSLRASFVTIAKVNGPDDLEVMNQTKHRTTMIQRYGRRRNNCRHNASGKLGLYCYRFLKERLENVKLIQTSSCSLFVGFGLES